LVIAAVASASFSSMAAAQLPVAPLPDIYESYNDCFVATAEGVDSSKLDHLGWKRVQIDGKPSADPAIFGHDKRAPLILMSGKGNEGMCAVVARLESAAAFDELVSAWQGIKFDKKGEASFFAERHPIIVTKTGTRDAPAVRLVVGPPVEKK
jgi:hypothetical protein